MAALKMNGVTATNVPVPTFTSFIPSDYRHSYFLPAVKINRVITNVWSGMAWVVQQRP